MKKPFVTIFLIVFIIILIVLLVALFYKYNLNNQDFDNRISTQSSIITDKDKTIEDLNRHLSACENDAAYISDDTTSIYDFNQIGLYSPLLLDSQVNTTIYDYNGSLITSQSIHPSQEINGFTWYLQVWLLTKNSGHLTFNPTLVKLLDAKMLEQDFPIFSDFRYLEAKEWVSDKIIEWQQHPETRKVTKNGLTMYEDRSDFRSSLEGYQPHLMGYYPAYFYLSISDPPADNKDQNNSPVVQREKTLLEIADTLSLYHP